MQDHLQPSCQSDRFSARILAVSSGYAIRRLPRRMASLVVRRLEKPCDFWTAPVVLSHPSGDSRERSRSGTNAASIKTQSVMNSVSHGRGGLNCLTVRPTDKVK